MEKDKDFISIREALSDEEWAKVPDETKAVLESWEPYSTTDSDNRLQCALSKIEIILKEQDLIGYVVIASDKRTAGNLFGSATWSCLKSVGDEVAFDPEPGEEAKAETTATCLAEIQVALANALTWLASPIARLSYLKGKADGN